MGSAFVVGITGHRDLKLECLDYYREQLFALLVTLKARHTNVLIYSPLSDGADRLIVKEGIKLDIPFVAVLPMLKEQYIRDFERDSREEFNALLGLAQGTITIPLCQDNTLADITYYSSQRDKQYEACGHFIAKNCKTLVALWDGKDIGLVGGTGEIVKFYLTQKNAVLQNLSVSRSSDTNNVKVKFNKIENVD